MSADTQAAPGTPALPKMPQRYVEAAAELLALLADPTRIQIILVLGEGELPVGEIAARVDKTPTSVSRHLAKLRWGRIVSSRQEGTRVLYRLVDEHARNLIDQAMFQAEHMVDAVPLHHHSGHHGLREEPTVSHPTATQATDAG
jgi:DNA-binding transcriptional ArsR family regulator